MKVLLSNTDSSGTMGSIEEELRSRKDIDLEVFNYREFYNIRGVYRLSKHSKKIKKIIGTLTTLHLKRRAEKFDPDLLLSTKGELLDPKILQEISNCKKIYWFPDDPQKFSISKEKSKGFDLVLTNSKAILDNYTTDARFFPFPCPINLYPEEENKEKEFNISYIGTHDEKRERYLSTLAKNFENVFIGGPGWPDIEGAEVKSELIPIDQVLKIYSKSKIIFNVAKNREHLTIRIFEANGFNSSLVVSEELVGLRNFYNEDEVPTFSEKEEMINTVQKILENDDLRSQISQNSQEKTLEEYTPQILVNKIIKIYEEL